MRRFMISSKLGPVEVRTGKIIVAHGCFRSAQWIFGTDNAVDVDCYTKVNKINDVKHHLFYLLPSCRWHVW